MTTKRSSWILFFLFICFVPLQEATTRVHSISKIVNANNKFAFNLYKNVKEKDKNIFFSPYSISMAFAMAYEGAGGKTAAEIRQTLNFPSHFETIRSVYKSFHSLSNKANKDFSLSTANSFWAQKDFPLLNKYLKIIRHHYSGQGENVNYKTDHDREKARERINTWIAGKTHNKINNLLAKGALHAGFTP